MPEVTPDKEPSLQEQAAQLEETLEQIDDRLDGLFGAPKDAVHGSEGIDRLRPTLARCLNRAHALKGRVVELGSLVGSL